MATEVLVLLDVTLIPTYRLMWLQEQPQQCHNQNEQYYSISKRALLDASKPHFTFAS